MRVLEGRDAIRQFIQGATAALARIESTADNVFIAGDGAAFKWSMRLTSKRGQSVAVEGIDVIQVNDQGKIRVLNAYWDPAPVLAVLRGVPQPPPDRAVSVPRCPLRAFPNDEADF